LEEKAKQLALTSKFKSEFLANMSHELRTPLNSLLILSDQLSKNPEGNLTGKQTQFARTIHAAGNDLLTLINDILDLSKIESGTVVVDIEEYAFAELRTYVERTFGHVAEARRLAFEIDIASTVPRALHTDSKRLQQVLKNLLSNAFKFTEAGKVSLRIAPATGGWDADIDTLNSARAVVAITVSDTGIGIPPEKQKIIFEAFQQADGSTSRKYGGTGLGLAISRELSRLLGGELRVESKVNEGSAFTLYLPLAYVPTRPASKVIAGAKAPAYKATEGGVVGRGFSPADAPGDLVGRGFSPADHAGAKAPAYKTTESAAPAYKTPEGGGVGRGFSPADPVAPAEAPREAAADPPPDFDDRRHIHAGDRVLLVIENDVDFAQFLLDTGREQGFKGIVSTFGAAGVALARDFKPDAITLDIRLPDIDGWRVLATLKRDVTTRHIPVFVITTEDERARGYELGAFDVLGKPVRTKDVLQAAFRSITDLLARTDRSLLVVGEDEVLRQQVIAVTGRGGLVVHEAATWEAALDVVDTHPVDCAVLTASLDDVPVPRVAERLAARRPLPFIAYAPQAWPRRQQNRLKKLAQVAHVTSVRTPEGLLEEAARHLHWQAAEPRTPQTDAQAAAALAADLAGKRALIVDDDIRNIFAMTSVLEQHGMVVESAENGRDAIDLLRSRPGIDIVLMDIMMPEMDGYDTIRAIRKIPSFGDLPIVAVTAKAMKGDREKCIEAGAWDYLAKPIDSEQMIAVCKSWLAR
ncbi:MAG: response regulator, partial [Bacteroidales bacterium]